MISAAPLVVGADDDSAPVEAALLGPASHQKEQRAAESDQHDHPGDIKVPSQTRENWSPALAKNEMPMTIRNTTDQADREPEILLLVAAERLHLVDVGGLERESAIAAMRRWRRDVVPLEAIERNHIGGVDREADQHHQRELDEADDAGEHDRRIGGGRSAVRRSSARPATARASGGRRRPASGGALAPWQAYSASRFAA